MLFLYSKCNVESMVYVFKGNVISIVFNTELGDFLFILFQEIKCLVDINKMSRIERDFSGKVAENSLNSSGCFVRNLN